MTSRERVAAALRGEAPDRTPTFEYVLLSPVADALLGRPYTVDESHWPAAERELGWRGAVRQAAVDRVDLAERLDHDLVYVWPATPPERPGQGEAPAAPDRPDDPVERVARRNAEAAQTPAGPPDHALEAVVRVRDELERRGLDLPILAPAYFHGVWTDADLMMAMALAPEVARDHFRQATRRAVAWIEAYASAGVDQVGVGGDFSGQRPILSPKSYREIIVPEVRTAARRARELGMASVNASDGNLWPVIEDFLLGCEVDAYLEIDQGAGMDLARLQARFGGRVAFYGNLDCGALLSFGTPEEVRLATLRCLDEGGGAGHVLCASNAITATVPLANYLAVVAAYRERYGLPAFSV